MKARSQLRFSTTSEIEWSAISKRLFVIFRAWHIKRQAGYLEMTLDARPTEIQLLSVQAEFQRQGAGRKLLRLAISTARHAGKQSVSLMVRADNRAARSLYESLGFQVEGREGHLIKMYRPLAQQRTKGAA